LPLRPELPSLSVKCLQSLIPLQQIGLASLALGERQQA
jgi:hypothetical protein